LRLGAAENAVVKDVAQKFPEMGGSPCAALMDIAIYDLLGLHVPVDGRVPRAGGRPVKSGTVYDPGPEELAFGRWQQGVSQERSYAWIAEVADRYPA
jgi:hypothetical protein